MVNAGKKTVDVWGGASYKVPLPYLRQREAGKKVAEDKKSRFVSAPGDGPQYKFGKTKKGMNYQINVYGKDGKEPPMSYLPLKEWAPKDSAKKPENKGDTKKDAKSGRGTFIDSIFFYGQKYNYPGPDKYFSEAKKKEKEGQKDADKLKDKKKPERPTFLSDYQYLAMNNPAPGDYTLKDTWAASASKRKPASEEKKKPAYVPGGWKVKNDKGQAPGQYEVTRLMTVAEAKDAEGAKGKSMKRFASIPVFERPKLGIINKKHDAKRSVEAPPVLAAPGTYFKGQGELEKTFNRIVKPMRKY